jgi:hypothetical protein
MSDKQIESLGDRINKAVAEERAKILGSKVSLDTKIGWQSMSPHAPFFTLTITGGDRDKVQALGQRLAGEALAALDTLKSEAFQ